MLILANFGQFLGILTQNCDVIGLTPKVCSWRGDTRFEILLVEVGSGCIVEKCITLRKEKSYWQHSIGGDASLSSDCYQCGFVPIRNQLCQIIYIFIPLVVCGWRDAENWVLQMDLRGDLYNS